ncbi:MAG: M3 family oligoendopeptidase [Nanoarchaeota archaeon]
MVNDKISVGKKEWDLSCMFSGVDAPEIELSRNKIKKKVDSFVSKWKENDRYLSDPEVLKEALDEYDALDIIGPGGGDGAGTLDSFYFWLMSQKDQNNSDIKARYGKSIEFGNSLFNSIRFFRLNLAKINKDVQDKFLKSPNLEKYRHFIERCFVESKYMLSVDEENILTLKQIPAYEQWDKMLSGLLSKEERKVFDESGNLVDRNFSEILGLLTNVNKKIRDSAAKELNDILKKYEDVAEAEINAILTNKKIDDDLRNVDRPDRLRHVSDDIESEIVDVLIEAVEKRFDISKRYYKLKARLLGVEKLEYHERSVPYGSDNRKYSYENSIEIVRKVFFDLDEEFLEIFNRFIKEGKVDVFPKKGKRAGAFCTDSLKYQSTYVMLNHTDELNDVKTIAHEFGHAINSELMKKKCTSLDCGMVLATAEVASTFMEDFVFQILMKEANEEEKLSLLISKLNDDISSVIRQIAAYKFEQDLHSEFRKKGYLSKTEIGELFTKNMFAYMGDFVEKSEGCENWWIFWHHFRVPFYVYSYASGLLISKTMQSKVKENKKFIENVKEFLSSGMSESPKRIFAKMGIDIEKESFWDSGLNEIEELLIETEDLAKKLGKI